MNFFETQQSILKCITVMKFRDNIRFQLDDDSIREEVKVRFNKEDDLYALKGRGTIVELGSGMRHEEQFILSFHGFFKQNIEGRIWLPAGVGAKDYDRYTKATPYLLLFKYEDLERFGFRKA